MGVPEDRQEIRRRKEQRGNKVFYAVTADIGKGILYGVPGKFEMLGAFRNAL